MSKIVPANYVPKKLSLTEAFIVWKRWRPVSMLDWSEAFYAEDKGGHRVLLVPCRNGNDYEDVKMVKFLLVPSGIAFTEYYNPNSWQDETHRLHADDIEQLGLYGELVELGLM